MSEPSSTDDRLTPEEFEAALAARYQRLSLLTADLAEEAGEAAVNFSHVDKGPGKGRFERRIGAMTRAIWAHRVIEQLRGRAERRGRGNAILREPDNLPDRHHVQPRKGPVKDLVAPDLGLGLGSGAEFSDGSDPHHAPERQYKEPQYKERQHKLTPEISEAVFKTVDRMVPAAGNERGDLEGDWRPSAEALERQAPAAQPSGAATRSDLVMPDKVRADDPMGRGPTPTPTPTPTTTTSLPP